MGEVETKYLGDTRRARLSNFLRHYGSHVLADQKGRSVYNLYGTTVVVYDEGKAFNVSVNSRDMGLAQHVSEVIQEKVFKGVKGLKGIGKVRDASGSGGCHAAKAVD